MNAEQLARELYDRLERARAEWHKQKGETYLVCEWTFAPVAQRNVMQLYAESLLRDFIIVRKGKNIIKGDILSATATSIQHHIVQQRAEEAAQQPTLKGRRAEQRKRKRSVS